jgi:hypothetical protein
VFQIWGVSLSILKPRFHLFSYYLSNSSKSQPCSDIWTQGPGAYCQESGRCDHQLVSMVQWVAPRGSAVRTLFQASRLQCFEESGLHRQNGPVCYIITWMLGEAACGMVSSFSHHHAACTTSRIAPGIPACFPTNRTQSSEVAVSSFPCHILLASRGHANTHTM